MLMTGIGGRGFNSKWVAHEIEEHESRLAFSQSIDHPQANLPGDISEHDQKSLSETEHHLLHSASHCELSPIPTLGAIPLVSCGFARSSLILQTIPPSKPERTFRPPRSTSLV